MMKDDQDQPHKSWLQKLSETFHSGPQTKEDLFEILGTAAKHHLLNNEALKMIEGVLAVSSMQVRDIMIPRTQMTVVNINQKIEELLPIIVNATHSRFPVIDDNKEDVVGILLAKDLLRYYVNNQTGTFHWSDMLRPAFFVPESKKLDALLNEFKSSHNHLAIVIDEYGAIAGLVTIEDVLEEIVGNIEDEFDQEPIYIQKLNDWTYLVNALTLVEDFNEFFDAEFSDKEVDTMGGIIVQEMGYVPKPGEIIELHGFKFKVSKSDGRRIQSLEASKISPQAS